MSLLPSRQIHFGASRPNQYLQQQQQYQAQQAAAAAAAAAASSSQSSGLALPTGSGLALPVSSNLALPSSAAPVQPLKQPQPFSHQSNAVAGPSSPPSSTAVPSTPAPLSLEQQHITAVEGIVPTLQNIVATVNLDCRLDLKTIALHARNAEYNPKVCIFQANNLVE